jgi:hypothetical protein
MPFSNSLRIDADDTSISKRRPVSKFHLCPRIRLAWGSDLVTGQVLLGFL